MRVRVRFAPSPTGPLHIGGVRTALFNYLFAKKNNGDFLLRIEDTDQKRYVNGAEKYIVDSLKWVGLKFDEGTDFGGKYGPYRQSERKEIYEKYINILLEKKKAYYAFDTAEDLEEMRKRLEEQKSSVRHYNFVTRTEMKNSFTLSAKEVKAKIKNGEPYVIRFDMPEERILILNDLIRGEIQVKTSTLDDKVLFKSDGLPTYHLANIVDDHLMEISHVIRGEEWLPSLALHYLIYEAFEWTAPEFAHLPLILKPNGKGKLSKRDGDQMGFPVFPLEWTDPDTSEKSNGYRESGYLPEAVVNMLAFLGWNPGDEQEVFSLEDLVEKFDLLKVQKAGAKFDPEKAKWYNQQHLRNLSSEKLAENFILLLKQNNINSEIKYVTKVVDLVKDRAVFEHDLLNLSLYFFTAPLEYDENSLKKHWKEQSSELVEKTLEYMKTIENYSSKSLEENLIAWIQEKGFNLGKVLNPIRLLLVGQTSGPHLFDIIELLGKEETLLRIDNGLRRLSK